MKLNMKSVTSVLLLTFAVFNIWAQTPKKKIPGKTKKKAETESVYSYVDSIPFPAKFKNESVVILGQYEKIKMIVPGEKYNYPGETQDYTSENILAHVFNITRYLLQDENAIQKFSTYYFSETEHTKGDITIIKKSGERNVVDLSKAIEVKESYGGSNLEFSFGKYKKIALPGLEVGDMIEYSSRSIVQTVNLKRLKTRVSDDPSPFGNYSWNQNNNYNSSMYNGTSFVVGSEFALIAITALLPHMVSTKDPTHKRTEGVLVPEFIVHLKKAYPVVKQSYDVETNKSFIPIEYSVVNGAEKPDLKAKGDIQTLHIEADTCDKEIKEYFYYDDNNIPAIKYTFNVLAYEKLNMHFNNINGDGLGQEEALLLGKKLIKSKWKTDAISKIFDFDKFVGNKLNRKSTEEKLKYAYYYFKKYYSLSAYIYTRGDKLTSESSMSYAKFMQLFCVRYDIPYDLVIWSPRASGASKYAVSGDHIRYGIIAYNGKKAINLTDYDAYSEFNIPHQALYGAEVFYVKPGNKYSVRSEIFAEDETRNKMIVKTEAAVNDVNTGMVLRTAYTITGELKNNNYEMVTNRGDFVKQYKSLLGDKVATEKTENVDYLDLYYYSADFKTKEKQDAEKERLTKTVDKNFALKENNKFENHLDGIYNKETKVNYVDISSKGLTTIKSKAEEDIGFTVKFNMDNTVNSVGNGALVVDLGRLMSEQFEIKDISDRKRVNAIDVNYTKAFDYTIKFTIPAGYKAVNLSDFVAQTENDLCSFSSTATEQNGTIVFHSVKEYRKVHAEANEWNKMIDVMDVAAKIFQKKLLLEKINP
jgi:hypothetical protein